MDLNAEWLYELKEVPKAKFTVGQKVKRGKTIGVIINVNWHPAHDEPTYSIYVPRKNRLDCCCGFSQTAKDLKLVKE